MYEETPSADDVALVEDMDALHADMSRIHRQLFRLIVQADRA